MRGAVGEEVDERLDEISDGKVGGPGGRRLGGRGLALRHDHWQRRVLTTFTYTILEVIKERRLQDTFVDRLTKTNEDLGGNMANKRQVAINENNYNQILTW